MSIRFGSVCSGIEAASVATEPLGWSAAWLAEIEPFPSAVLAYHYPSVPNLGDMRKLPAMVRAGQIEAPDVLVGGTPCQAFSVAGVRAGLLDPRGQLTLTYVDLLNAIDEQRPGDECVGWWENVPGVLSDKTNAFGCFLGLLAGEECELFAPGGKWPDAGVVHGPQRTIAWRILDAQYIGLAQRRRRVFVIASARDGFDPATILFEQDGVRRDSAPSRETGQDTACAAGPGVAGRSHWDGDYPHPTMNQSASGSGGVGASNQEVFSQRGVYLVRASQHGVAYSVALRGRDGGATAELGDNLAGTLRASGGGGDKAHVLAFSAKDHGGDATVEMAPTMRSMGHDGSHANGGGQLAVCVTGTVTHCLKAEGFDASEDGTGRGQSITVAHSVRLANTSSNGWGIQEEVTHTLDSTSGPAVHSGMAVRRLIPVECERLQGFPDDYTLIPWTEYQRLQKRATKAGSSFEAELRKRGKILRGPDPIDCPDGPRYKALGNSMAVTVMAWIARRLHAALVNAS